MGIRCGSYRNFQRNDCFTKKTLHKSHARNMSKTSFKVKKIVLEVVKRNLLFITTYFRLIHKVDDTERHKWALPLFGPLDDVVNRSQRYFYKHCRKRPIQVQSYILMNSFVYAIITIFLAVTFFILSQFKFGRYLLTQVQFFI